MKHLIRLLAALALLGGATLTAVSSTATAADPESCEDPTITVVVEEAFTETITVVDEEAFTEVIEGTPGVWANWSPNNTQGPQDYVPIWPQDDRGTWHVHDQGVPPGHEGPDGVYQQGGGNSPWFYRQAGTEDQTIEHPAVTHEETIEHPEVTEEQPNPAHPCDTPKPPVVIDPEPKDPKDPEDPEEPVKIEHITDGDKQVTITTFPDGSTEREVTPLDSSREEGF